jgi:hypothetical protein
MLIDSRGAQYMYDWEDLVKHWKYFNDLVVNELAIEYTARHLARYDYAQGSGVRDVVARNWMDADNLPTEVWVNILQFLVPADRFSSRAKSTAVLPTDLKAAQIPDPTMPEFFMMSNAKLFNVYNYQGADFHDDIPILTRVLTNIGVPFDMIYQRLQYNSTFHAFRARVVINLHALFVRKHFDIKLELYSRTVEYRLLHGEDINIEPSVVFTRRGSRVPAVAELYGL